MTGWFGSLRGRITLVTVAVAVLAVLVTGLVSVQLVRQSTIDHARARLTEQAQLLSRLPVALSLSELSDRIRLAPGNTEVGIVSNTGLASGPATVYLSAANIRTLLAGAGVSLRHRGLGGTILLEAKPARRGGAVVLALSLNTVDEQNRASAVRIALALGIGTAVAILAGTLLARWLSKPLVETARTARRMAAGERGLRVKFHTPSEVAAVANALASLDRALATSESRQREFLLSISHELRTPLTAVRGYAEAMADELVGPDDIASVGRTLVAETERLDRFVADLLELARLEADDFSITPQEVEVPRLLSEIREAWLARSSKLGVEVSANAADHLPSVTTDARRLRQVIDGLVENALRVAPEGTAIALIARTDGARTLIEVRDAGPGLSAEDQAVAFDRGVLRDRYRDIRSVGTGLGLSIASRLTARLGGTIRVASSPADGTVFTVSLPTARAE
ncbi:MAG: HAMP domain-containing sensor histidine kinase [Lacisediminihabitans sp.]